MPRFSHILDVRLGQELPGKIRVFRISRGGGRKVLRRRLGELLSFTAEVEDGQSTDMGAKVGWSCTKMAKWRPRGRAGMMSDGTSRPQKKCLSLVFKICVRPAFVLVDLLRGT